MALADDLFSNRKRHINNFLHLLSSRVYLDEKMLGEEIGAGGGVAVDF